MASNLLISSLPDDLREIVTSELETIKLEIKSYMMRPGQSITHVYFPTTGMISVVVALENGGTVETLTIAHEGFCGIPLLLGQQIATRDAFVQIAGEFQRMDSEVFLALLRDHPEMRDSLQAYANYALTVAEQSAACLAYHSLDSRLARWLLTVSDRFPGDELQLTQEFLGQMLGVYRPSVTLAMGLLQETGLIAHRRGVVRIIDRQRLEDAACECYRVTRRWPGIPN